MSEYTQIRATRHTMDELTIYEVNETELTILEQGTVESLMTDISIALLSVFVSLLSVLITTPMDIIKFIIFVLVDIVSGLTGVILLILALKSRKSTKSIIVQIRSRKKVPEGIQQEGNIQVT